MKWCFSSTQSCLVKTHVFFNGNSFKPNLLGKRPLAGSGLTSTAPGMSNSGTLSDVAGLQLLREVALVWWWYNNLVMSSYLLRSPQKKLAKRDPASPPPPPVCF